MTNINSANRMLHRNLPALLAFHVVARHGSFTSAAQALGLTQSSISQRIKALEADLGVTLFTREHRGVTVTTEGLRLLNVVAPAMSQIHGSMSAFLERKRTPRVRISSDFAFSTFWLMPRLGQLRAELGDEVDIQILASQAPPRRIADECDIAIHVTALGKMLPGQQLLMDERVAAVCSPGFLSRNGPITSSSDLLDQQLLSVSRPPSAEWQTWQGWFASMGIPDYRSQNFVSFNNYDMVIQAAVAGEGVALGWLGLIDYLIKNRSLVLATDAVVVSEAAYVMSVDGAVASDGQRTVFDWIVDQINQGPSDMESAGLGLGI